MDLNNIQIIGNQIQLSSDHPQYSSIRLLLSPLNENGVIERLYQTKKDGSIVFDRGLISVLPSLGLSKEILSKPDDLKVEFQDIEPSLLEGYELEPEQLLAIKTCLIHKRGFIQASTGSGKTLMICGFLKYLGLQLGYYPDTLILVPTSYLVDQMINVMNSVGIPVVPYNESRGTVKGVVVTCPKSVNNDIDNNLLDLTNIKILIADEAHHLKSRTWSTLVKKSVNSNYILGFSASIIPSKRLPITRISQLSIDEIKIIGTAGNILLDLPASHYAGRGRLATPKVIVIDHQATEHVEVNNNWTQLRKNRLESEARTQKISQVASIFNSFGLKVLILISTYDHGYQILDNLSDLGLGEVSACSYGNNQFYKKVEGELVTLPPDSMNNFKEGQLQILIGSTHIFEGVDIPSLDVVIMAVVGKSTRRIIQGVGRALRITKNGKYAYIVDFSDTRGGILEYHTSQRLKVYKDQIGVPDNDIFKQISLSQLPILINNLESISFE